MDLLTLNTAAEYDNFNNLARKHKIIEFQTYFGGVKSSRNSWHWIDSGAEIQTVQWRKENSKYISDHNKCSFFVKSAITNITIESVPCNSQENVHKFICQRTVKFC